MRMKSERMSKTCPCCKKEFLVPSYLSRINFCSRKCYANSMKGRSNPNLKEKWKDPAFRKFHEEHAKSLHKFRRYPNELVQREIYSQAGKKAWNTLLQNEGKKIVLDRIERVRMARIKNLHKTSFPQTLLFEVVQKFSSEACLEYRVETLQGRKFRFLDVALPSLKIGLEYDGEPWHSKKRDEERDKELAEVGWTIFHFNKEFYPSYTSVCMVLEGLI